MNEFENELVNKTLEGIHQLEMKVVELQGSIKAMREHSDDQYKTLTEKITTVTETNTQRLNAHSEELDNNRERLATIEEWKKQFEEAIRNRLLVSQSITTVAAVLIAYALSKFL